MGSMNRLVADVLSMLKTTLAKPHQDQTEGLDVPGLQRHYRSWLHTSTCTFESQSVQLIHKDDTGCSHARTLEQVTHTRSTQAHNALSELSA
jgi:hypothetical protein